MQGRLRRGAEWHSDVHKVRVLRRPLIGLGASHRPAHHSAEVLDPKMLRDEFILSSHIIVEGTPGKWTGLGLVRGRRGLAVAKERRHNDEELLWVEGLVLSD